MNINGYLINEDLSLVETMNRLDKVAKKILFIIKDKKLVASITDGDIRRWILKNGDLKASIKNIGNYNPKYLNIIEKMSAKHYINKYMINAIPIVDDDGCIVSIVFRDNSEINNTLNIPVVIMAGGLGKRLEPYTKILPKPLIPVGNIPITERIINNFTQFGVKDFYLILNHKRNMIKAYFSEINKDYNINYIEETNFLGTAGGLGLLKNKINQTFILSNCDILVLEDYNKIYDFHKKNKNIITIIASLKNFKIPYGTIDITSSGTIDKLKEKPELCFFINTGMYVVDPIVIEEIEENKALDFPDLVNKYKQLNKTLGLYPISENSWLDMGELDKMEQMNIAINNYNSSFSTE